MGYALPPDLQELVDARLATGLYPTEGDVLRAALRALAQEDDDLAAVREAVADWKAGDAGTPLTDAFEQLAGRPEGEK
jgi:putative addiction module CopG family antidote